MIVRYLGDRTLVDREALSLFLRGRPQSTIRAKCQPVACDIHQRRTLYDAFDCAARLATLPRRNRKVAQTARL